MCGVALSKPFTVYISWHMLTSELNNIIYFGIKFQGPVSVLSVEMKCS